MQIMARILTSLGDEFTVIRETRGKAVAAAVEMLEEGEKIVNIEFSNHYPDKFSAVFVMDGRRQEMEFYFLSAFNVFLRRNKARIYGIKLIGGGNGRKINAIMNMHGVKFI